MKQKTNATLSTLYSLAEHDMTGAVMLAVKTDCFDQFFDGLTTEQRMTINPNFK